MDFAPKPGCPMCAIVAHGRQSAGNAMRNLDAPRSASRDSRQSTADILWQDDNFTIYRETKNPVSSNGHIVVIFNLHVPSIYSLSSSDIPLLVQLRSLCQQLLSTPSISNSPTPSVPSSPGLTPISRDAPSAPPSTPLAASSRQSSLRIGFITPPFKDSRIPVTDHLHAHAYVPPNDLCGWWRKVAYGPLAWYAVDDLIAEIRESTSNNRVRSGHDFRPPAPIDMVPDAGARTGTADGLEITEAGIATADIESQRQ